MLEHDAATSVLAKFQVMVEAFGLFEKGTEERKTSPHLAQLYGWALWNSFLFIDKDDEAAFVRKDFAAMKQTSVSITALQLLILPYSFTPLGEESRCLLWAIVPIVTMQLYTRLYFDDARHDARWFAWFYGATTLAMWCLLIAVDLVTGFAPIVSSTIFVVLFFFIFAMLYSKDLLKNTYTRFKISLNVNKQI